MGRISFRNSSEIRHAYIICSDSEDERFGTALEIAKAAVCRSTGTVPCNNCNACIKVDKGIHPDVRVILKGEAKAKNEISIDQVRNIVLDSVVLPNEAAKKVYIFKDGDAMKEPAQNAALKLLEEPPEGVILILCASRPENFLQTVRSRCHEIVCNSGAKAEESSPEGLAETYLLLCAEKKTLELFKLCEDNNGISAQEMSGFLTETAEALTDMLCGRRSSMGIDPQRLMEMERLIEKCIGYLKVNVNVRQIFGLLEVDSIPRSKK